MATAWCLLMIPIFWEQSPVEGIAKHIIAEDSFKIESLVSVKAGYVDAWRLEKSSASVLSAVAVINLRLLENAIARNDLKNLDSLMRDTGEMIRQSLVRAPADPFLWTVLFWLENTRDGFGPGHLEYLNMSYTVGPNEGWIAVKRNRFALAVFSALTPSLSETAVGEFARLVGSNYFDAAADILEGPGWPMRDTLMSKLKSVGELNREVFAKVIYRRGINLEIPSVERPDWRPWH